MLFFEIPVMIVPVLKHYDKLQEMLDSIDYYITHAIIIDNGGKLKSLKCDYIEKISIINMQENIGVPTAWNLGIKLEPFARYWLFSQDDIVWVPGGLQRVDQASRADCICIDMDGPRPFSSFTVGEQVIQEVGIFDESYFPLLGDDFNFHKRCHVNQIEEINIGGTFIAEKSASIKHLLKNGDLSPDVISDNYNRSIFGPPVNSGWSLERRRWQGRKVDKGLASKGDYSFLDYEYTIHNEIENRGFKMNIDTP
jgi:hypothetical protein